MIVADTSALISLAMVDCIGTVLEEYEVHTTGQVVAELEETAGFDDAHGEGARTVLDHIDGLTVHEVGTAGSQSSRIDAGEGSCLALDDELEAAFLLTDDFRALPELQPLANARVALSPLMLSALVKRGVLTRTEATQRLETLAQSRGWLGAPIYRRAKSLFEE